MNADDAKRFFAAADRGKAIMDRMDTTNEQAPYGKNVEAFDRIMAVSLAMAEAMAKADRKPTERAPMLSNDDCEHMSMKRIDVGPLAARDVRDFYEAKITSGELRVVKKAHNVWNGINRAFQCLECGYVSVPAIGLGEFCRCGAQITK